MLEDLRRAYLSLMFHLTINGGEDKAEAILDAVKNINDPVQLLSGIELASEKLKEILAGDNHAA